MPSVQTLRLDTRAPVVTWGPVENAISMEEMTVAYTVDEPGIESAEVRLIDGRVLPMTVEAALLRLQLPDDAPDGQAEVRAYVRDDVDNTATRTLTFVIDGVPYVPPVQTQPSLSSPPQRARPAPVQVTSPISEARVTDSFTVRALSPSVTRLRLRSRYVAPTRRTLFFRERLVTDSTTRTAATIREQRATPAVDWPADSVWKRPEGPRTEEALILLDLL